MRAQLRDFCPVPALVATEVLVWQGLWRVSEPSHGRTQAAEWYSSYPWDTARRTLLHFLIGLHCIFFWLFYVFCSSTYWWGTAFVYLLPLSACLALPYNTAVCITSFSPYNFYFALSLHISWDFVFWFLSPNCNPIYFWSLENSKMSFLKQTQGFSYHTFSPFFTL